MDYLGNKAGFAAELVRLVGRRVPAGSQAADVFAGTGAVSLALARAGYRVLANDHLPLGVALTRAQLLGAGATFRGLKRELGPLGCDPLTTVLQRLSDAPGVEGWVTRNYSPVSFETAGVERRYLTESNARRVDAIRLQIREWEPVLTEAEHALLLACLVEAVAEVGNVAGTYGCYLKNWKGTALRPLELRPIPELAATAEHAVLCTDAEEVAAETEADVIYADPPYTKRQYAAYYHLLNSIVVYDEPALTGSTGLPDWKPLASDWCYKTRAPRALERLVAKSSAPVFALSYSSDGHIPDADIRDVLATHGRVEVWEFDRRRYRSSALPHKADRVFERLYLMAR
ncbi:MAG: DNA adenine methylase [Sporichthyaceae bacterium]